MCIKAQIAHGKSRMRLHGLLTAYRQEAIAELSVRGRTYKLKPGADAPALYINIYDTDS